MNSKTWSIIQQECGKRVKAVRAKAGVSQRELGRMTGIAGGHICEIEAGRGVGLRRIYAIAEALGVEPKELIWNG